MEALHINVQTKEDHTQKTDEQLQAENVALKQIINRQNEEIRALEYRITTLLRTEL